MADSDEKGAAAAESSLAGESTAPTEATNGTLPPSKFPEGSQDEPTHRDGEAALIDSRTVEQLVRTRALLVKAGMTQEQVGDWLATLCEMDLHSLSDEDISNIIFGDEEPSGEVAPATKAAIRRALTIRWHAGLKWWHHKTLWVRITYTVLWLNLLVPPIIQRGFTWGTIVSLVGIVFIKGWRIAVELDPGHMRTLERNYDQRKLLAQKAIHTQQLWLTAPPNERELAAQQQDIIELLALYIRDHRTDLKKKKVFVNLLVRDHDEVVVVRRCSSARPVPQRYSREECNLVWRCLNSGNPVFTGDVHLDDPRTAKTKGYHSILVLPVKLAERTVAAVSIDSEWKYHFDAVADELSIHLAPYLQLLATTLTPPYVAERPT